MTHEFVILKDNELKTYNDFDKIPESFDNLISFKPVIPEGPHTEEQHNEIDKWQERFTDLMKRETK